MCPELWRNCALLQPQSQFVGEQAPNGRMVHPASCVVEQILPLHVVTGWQSRSSIRAIPRVPASVLTQAPYSAAWPLHSACARSGLAAETIVAATAAAITRSRCQRLVAG